MTTKIVRVGNTLTVEVPGIRLPRLRCPSASLWNGLRTGQAALPWSEKERLNAGASKRMTLEELLKGIPEGAEMEKVEWGPDRGAEVW